MKYFVTQNLECLCAEEAQPEGFVIKGHAHYHDHLTLCHEGEYDVLVHAYEGGPVIQSTRISSNSQFPAVEIKAGIWHTLIARGTSNRYICIHACHNPMGELTVKRTGWERAETAGDRLCIPNKEA
jgi:hypothetical protein